MRRWIAGVVALTLCAGWMTIGWVRASHRCAPRIARAVAYALVLPRHFALVPAAMAEELKDWKSVPADSAVRPASRPRVRRTTATRAVSEAPAAPAVAQLDSLVPIESPAEPSRLRGPGHSGDMMRIGSDIHIEADQTVSGDVVAISGDVLVDGHVKGDVVAMRGDVKLSSSARVDGDVVCLGGELREDGGAYVGGQRVTALGGRRTHIQRSEHGEYPATRHLSRFMRTLISLLISLAMVWLFLRIASARTAQAVERLRHETAASFGIGMLAWVLLVPSLIALCLVVAILCITLIGIPVAIAALFAYFILVALVVLWGSVIGAAWIGEQIARREPSSMSLMRLAVMGTVLVMGARAFGYLIGVVPWFRGLGGVVIAVSWIVTGVVTTMGAGALLRSEFASGNAGQWWRGLRGRGGAPSPAPAAGPAAMADVPQASGSVGPATDLGIIRPAAGSGEPPTGAVGAPPADPSTPPPSEGG